MWYALALEGESAPKEAGIIGAEGTAQDQRELVSTGPANPVIHPKTFHR
jgi:hypothetical protein